MASSTQTTGNLWDWSARIHFDKYEMQCNVSVCLFLRDPALIPSDPENWHLQPTYIGSHQSFVGRGEHRTHGKKERMEEGFVHLTRAIAKSADLKDLEPERVAPYLKDKLHWKVHNADLEVVQLKSLEIIVFATLLVLRPGEMFPAPVERRQLNAITYGKPGGSREA
ncbi:hypothetical protein CPC08DRAFT_707855 [Agrocybe pediades]|nr:hypothetical protein CPC08DRAFT_707855 [Agrocybe pediades]